MVPGIPSGYNKYLIWGERDCSYQAPYSVDGQGHGGVRKTPCVVSSQVAISSQCTCSYEAERVQGQTKAKKGLMSHRPGSSVLKQSEKYSVLEGRKLTLPDRPCFVVGIKVTGEMIPFLTRCELSLIPYTHVKTPAVELHACNPSTGETGKGGFLVFFSCLSSQLTAFRASERPCLKGGLQNL